MKRNLQVIGRLGAIMAFLFCLLAGLWILQFVGLDKGKDGAVWSAMGLYFIGKAFFVGPMLWIVSADRSTRDKDGHEPPHP
jgi:hypothetical protein